MESAPGPFFIFVFLVIQLTLNDRINLLMTECTPGWMDLLVSEMAAALVNCHNPYGYPKNSILNVVYLK